VNNAGVAEKSFKTTPAGFEVAMGVKYSFRPVSPQAMSHHADENTSHLAHFLFTINLLPILKRTAEQKVSDVRVVNVPACPPPSSYIVPT
jgi:hypothetical protein